MLNSIRFVQRGVVFHIERLFSSIYIKREREQNRQVKEKQRGGAPRKSSRAPRRRSSLLRQRRRSASSRRRCPFDFSPKKLNFNSNMRGALSAEQELSRRLLEGENVSETAVGEAGGTGSASSASWSETRSAGGTRTPLSTSPASTPPMGIPSPRSERPAKQKLAHRGPSANSLSLGSSPGSGPLYAQVSSRDFWFACFVFVLGRANK
jgi:hypothetical protein